MDIISVFETEGGSSILSGPAKVFAPLDKLAKSLLSKGRGLPVRIGGGVPYYVGVSLVAKPRVVIPLS